MPIHQYPVIPIEIPPRKLESRGTRRKFWVVLHDNQTEWLLKFPRPGTGEHWAEKIAAEIGRLINVDTAQVELASSNHELATICRSFLPNEDDDEHTSWNAKIWFHGAEFLAMFTPGYDMERVWSNRAHNMKNIVSAVMEIAGVDGMNPMPKWDKMMEDLASYALLDGLIGNTDRHHQNWMIVYVEDSGNIRVDVAPSFDHASSLGRELLDERRLRILCSNNMLDYLKKGRGGVFVSDGRRHAPSPLRLAQLICRWQPLLARTWCDRLNSIPDEEFRLLVNKVPPEFMSDITKEFAYQVVVTSKVELLRSI